MESERDPAGAGNTAEQFLAGALASARRVLGDGAPSEVAVPRADADPPHAASDLGAVAGDADAAELLLARLARRDEARYRVEGEIDHGGQGTVLRVWDAALQRQLAMKTIRERGVRTPGTPPADGRSVARFLEEALVTGQLDHPGIVPVHELGLDDEGRVFFTMKLVRGEDLRAVFAKVREGRDGWSEARALGVMLKVCEAMAYAHAKGVIHRDLKPSNVMVGRFGEVHVVDWGLARVSGRADVHDVRVAGPDRPDELVSMRGTGTASDSPLRTQDGHVLGTPAYMPSEQALGKVDEIGPHSDVYAVGAMLYELLAGHPPYLERGKVPANHVIWWRVREGPPEALAARAPRASPELVAIAEKAMARDWRARYPDMGALAEDLRAWLEHRVVRAYETGRFAELRKWVARNRLFAASVAVSLLLLLTGTSATSLVLAGKNRALERAQLDTDELVLLGLEEQASALGPAEPTNTHPYEEWLARADELVARVEGAHRPMLVRLDAGAARAEPSASGAASDVAPERAERRERLASFVARVEALSSPTGARTRVADLLELARTLRARSLDGADVRTRWEEAIAAIRDSPVYEGLRLAPELGLVPLGKDEESGLWEFWHVASGSEPRRDERTGRVLVAAGDGVVLVLVPGGPTVMGAQATERHGARYDPLARRPMEEPHELELAPFFLSKYELTQDQWKRMTGSNPSAHNFHRYEPPSLFGKHRLTATHPVENVSWEEARATLEPYGLVLPTEAQWEHAVRAWSDTIWWTGDEAETLEGMENLADQALAVQGTPSAELEPWHDTYQAHAPVGSFTANPFGLHDMGGNVKEWCLDWLGQYAKQGFVPDTGERIVPGGVDRVVRGGSCFEVAEGARSALRTGATPRAIHEAIGVRPARALASARAGD